MVTTDTELSAQLIQLTYEIGECVESLFPAEAIDSDSVPGGNEKISSVLTCPDYFLVRLEKFIIKMSFSLENIVSTPFCASRAL